MKTDKWRGRSWSGFSSDFGICINFVVCVPESVNTQKKNGKASPDNIVKNEQTRNDNINHGLGIVLKCYDEVLSRERDFGVGGSSD